MPTSKKSRTINEDPFDLSSGAGSIILNAGSSTNEMGTQSFFLSTRIHYFGYEPLCSIRESTYLHIGSIVRNIRWATRVNFVPIFRQVHTSHFKCPQKSARPLVWE